MAFCSKKITTVSSMGEVKKCLLIGPGKPVEVKEGGKISITLGLLINICYNVQLFLT